MENTYTITLYYYNRSSNGIYTKTQLLKEAGKITGRESFTDVEAAKEVVAKDLNTHLGMCKSLNFTLPWMTILATFDRTVILQPN